MFPWKLLKPRNVSWMLSFSFTLVTCDLMKIRNMRQNMCIKNNYLVRIYGLSFLECVDECWRRPYCSSLSYRRRFGLCEINEINISLAVKECVGYAHVQRTDILMSEPEPCSSLCTDRGWCDPASSTCRIKECGPPHIVRDAEILGNQRVVGDKLKYTCVLTGVSTFVVCQENGTWSDTPVCFGKTIGTPCKIDSDCKEPKSLCIADTCFCTYTAKYNAQTGVCDIECDHYSSDFDRYQRKAIRQFNHYHHTKVTVQQCKDHCVHIGVTCGSFDYRAAGQDCQYGLINYQQVQDADPAILRDDNERDLYSRHC